MGSSQNEILVHMLGFLFSDEEGKIVKVSSQGMHKYPFLVDTINQKLSHSHYNCIILVTFHLLPESDEFTTVYKTRLPSDHIAQALRVSEQLLIYHQHNQIHPHTLSGCLGFSANAFLQCLPFMF